MGRLVVGVNDGRSVGVGRGVAIILIVGRGVTMGLRVGLRGIRTGFWDGGDV